MEHDGSKLWTILKIIWSIVHCYVYNTFHINTYTQENIFSQGGDDHIMHLDLKIYIYIYIPLNQLQDSSGSLCFIYNPLKLKLLLFNKKILYRMVPYISGETLCLWTSATWPKLRQFAIPTLFYPFHPYLPYMPHFI